MQMNLPPNSRTVDGWDAAPTLRVTKGAFPGDYRLADGRLEFRRAEQERWRSLDYSELQQHMALRTAVAQWLAQLYMSAKLAQVCGA